MNREICIHRIRSVRRVVIKVGSSLLTDSEQHGGINRPMIEKLRDEILFLRHRGVDVLLVSSGAVSVGREILHRFHISSGRENSIVRKQALSAVGQSRLMSIYREIMDQVDLPVAQLLITARDFRDRRAYLNIGHAIHELVSLRTLPIINENDTVSVKELQFGDNDILSASCASLFHADLLVILTNAPGFLVNDLRVPFLENLNEEHWNAAGGPRGPGSGGMITKIRAAHLGKMSGFATAILPGTDSSPVQSLFRGDDIGTIICGSEQSLKQRLGARKRWLLFSQTEGSITIDDGASSAIARGSSLLPAGISSVNGRFFAGDVIDIQNGSGKILGRGIVSYSYRELYSFLGMSGAEIRNTGRLNRGEEAIHRNNMILEKFV